METIILGDVEITRVTEHDTAPMPRELIFPDTPGSEFRKFYDAEHDAVLGGVQTWLVRSGGRTILVDTGIGNHKERPYMPLFAHHDTKFLEQLDPEEVDLVVHTHLHGDHVGWNTYLHNREWVPTFPNATHLMPRADFEFYHPDRNHNRRMQNVFEDSVLPVKNQTVLWEDRYDIDGNLRLSEAPGHTPGSAILTLKSKNETAVFVGDLLHSPLQIDEPECCPSFDEDPANATKSRKATLEWCRDHTALVLPAHFPGGAVFEMGARGVQRWR
ncbi:MBL fold metallo-hydrolase [Lentzea sp. NBRC 105346]|uniref:MBL fold metallo-hydrolase n=1 Tax=Lentzea sp. NBRC 105346 TaxID=3032205 RepID=UPI0024A01772|nr:MBL fold metallo-hydrolase [Lentzea sp. NBRC 105346]GLZ28474.1 MBL fold metallo-hydrolase [Lentzea sp. NBRC 105346]